MNWFTTLDQEKFSKILLFLLIVFLIIGFFGDSTSYFAGNLTPELTGVCIELLIIEPLADSTISNS